MYYNIPEYDFYCQQVLPLVYDQSLSYYETLCKMRDYLNNVIKSQNNLTEGFKKLLEWINTQLQNYTEEQLNKWLEDGTLEELINEKLFSSLNKRIDYIGIINIDEFPREENENDDAPRFQRAFDFMEGKIGTIKLNGENYYFETPSIHGKCFVKTYPNINLIGVNKTTIFLTENSAPSSIAPSFFRCLEISNAIYKNFNVATCPLCLSSDENFYDVFYFKYNSDTTPFINLTIENFKSKGWGYQAVLNIGILDETKINFGSGITIKDCEINQQGYVTCANNIVYDNVTWNCNVDVLRPSYLNNAVQTPIKYSGKKGFCEDGIIENCKIKVIGTRLPFNPFEFFRSNVIMENMIIETTKKGVITVGSRAGGKVSDYGVSNRISTLRIINSKLNDISLTPVENGVIEVYNCEFSDCNNLLFPCYEVSQKESDNPICEIRVYNSVINDSVNRIMTNKIGENSVLLNGCKIYYNREKSPNGGFSGIEESNIEVLNCIVTINGNSPAYFLNTKNANSLVFSNTIIVKGSLINNGEKILNAVGNINSIIISNCYNEALTIGKKFIDTTEANVEKLIVWNTNESEGAL